MRPAVQADVCNVTRASGPCEDKLLYLTPSVLLHSVASSDTCHGEKNDSPHNPSSENGPSPGLLCSSCDPVSAEMCGSR